MYGGRVYKQKKKKKKEEEEEEEEEATTTLVIVDWHRRFRGTYSLHLQSKSIFFRVLSIHLPDYTL